MAGLQAPPAAAAARPFLQELLRCERLWGAAGAALPGPGHAEAGGKADTVQGGGCRAGAGFAGRGRRGDSVRARQRNENNPNWSPQGTGCSEGP